LDDEALRAWTSALARWTAGPELPPALGPLAFGLAPRFGPVQQAPFGQEAADRLRTSSGLRDYLDATLLRPDATADEVRALAKEARTLRVFGACVHAVHVRTLAEALLGAEVVPVAVVGFPHGASRPPVKALEARLAVEDGARELDMVAALGALRAGDVQAALEDMVAVVDAARPWPVKVILETGLLDARAVALGAGLALVAGCTSVKTSTGVGAPGARPQDVAFLRTLVGEVLAVKASGGIRTRADALALVGVGASRLGTSSAAVLLARVT
jgi:deoxyribose-phosphate aldolase